ncbi:hypothetical protein [Micromonospora sp. MW-13]|uniref:hypothetical protein n=1 Tax=Micromonospora sp. MW-13 TaxID=2094022 RepID=UPI000FFEB61A|nr:hypothetical protein [Micromonospora sp. MW-13]
MFTVDCGRRESRILEGLCRQAGGVRASAYVVSAIRDRMRAEDLDAELVRRGMTVTAEGRARARALRARVEQEWTPGRRAALRERSR